MSRIINGNLIDALLDGEVDYIAHVCNNKGVMGSGVALEIKNRIPDAYAIYKRSEESGKLLLGNVSVSSHVFNLVAQDGYGEGRRHLNYGALTKCVQTLSKHLPMKKTIGFPYKVGSDRAGGDWEIVKEIIDFYLGDRVVYYKLVKQ